MQNKRPEKRPLEHRRRKHKNELVVSLGPGRRKIRSRVQRRFHVRKDRRAETGLKVQFDRKPVGFGCDRCRRSRLRRDHGVGENSVDARRYGVYEGQRFAAERLKFSRVKNIKIFLKICKNVKISKNDNKEAKKSLSEICSLGESKISLQSEGCEKRIFESQMPLSFFWERHLSCNGGRLAQKLMTFYLHSKISQHDH